MFLLAAAPASLVLLEAGAFSLGRPVVVSVLEALGPPICHHRPERTLTVDGRLLPVCARCTGLYAAGPLGLLTVFLGPLVPKRRLPLALGAAGAASAIGFAAALLEQFDLLRTPNAARVGLGLLLGLGPPAAVGLVSRALWDEVAGRALP